MAIPIQSNNIASAGNKSVLFRDKKPGPVVPQKFDNLSLKNESISYSSHSVKLQYATKDGDTVSFSYEYEELLQTNLKIDKKSVKEDFKNIAKLVKDEINNMKKVHINQFLKQMGFSVSETDDVENKTGILQIDEYWNAENTSQRIVDFAVSFYSLFEGSSDEYLQKIKDAVTDGFNQAKEILGSLPEPVADLMNSTFDMVMNKLDSWFDGIENHDPAQNITTEQEV
ncbi:MAG TPA: DUF5610 domain-containing protein [Chitinispirillaceae bacterium]|nr:DUF5610 domain-containing protein [Chitinispirillaceae bacterium]